jgi:phage gp46-like protein
MDIRLTMSGLGYADASVKAGDIETERGLETAVILSLLLDARARPDDAIPDGTDDRRGWWGDDDEVSYGSRLWLLERSTLTQETINQWRELAAEALAWMTDQGIVQRVTVAVERESAEAIIATIRLLRPRQRDLEFRFRRVWRETVEA